MIEALEFYAFVAVLWAIAAKQQGETIKASIIEGLIFPYYIFKALKK